MRKMQMTIVAMAAVLMLASGALAAKKVAQPPSGADGNFTDSLSTAVDQAKSNNRLIMLDFTGSDWCGYCIKLKEAVFDTKDFKTWASQNLVLVEVDFPQSKVLPKDVKEQNDKLKEKYSPKGYPSIVFVTSDGTEVGRMVGFGGDAKDWSKRAQEIVTKNAAGAKDKKEAASAK